MSLHYVSSVVPNDVFINADRTLTKEIQLRSAVFNQLTSAVTDVPSAGFNHYEIITQNFTTPHSTNNTTTFVVTETPLGVNTFVDVNMNFYSGTTGLPIVKHNIRGSDGALEITVINLSSNQDLNGYFRITVSAKQPFLY